MGDTNIVYDETFGINTFKREICAALGEEFWEELIKGITVPDAALEAQCKCRNMYAFMQRLEEMADAETVKGILYRVRHGLKVSQCKWAREKFLKAGSLDVFIREHAEEQLNHYMELNREKKDFYGQPITDEVLEFIRRNPAILAPVRKGNKLYCMNIPFNAAAYLSAEDERMKRYHFCHCQFAKESILSDSVVSSTLCNCSLGHMMNFMEAVLDRPLEGRTVHSVLKGDLVCGFEITIPEDIMKEYVTDEETDIIISNYYRYYHSFSCSGIIEYREGSVSSIMPREGERGPEMGFRLRFNKQTVQREVQDLIAGIRAGKLPKRWLVTPDAEPENIVSILEQNGFRNLTAEAPAPEPAMLLRKDDFQPYSAENNPVICRRIRSKEDFKVWTDIVNTALNGWDMIDAEHYYSWIEKGYLNIYLGELDGIPVTAAATIQNGDTGSLEFVATLEKYRRNKAAATVCSEAINDLFDKGVRTVTLSSCGESCPLYEGLGFHTCFYDIVMLYEM